MTAFEPNLEGAKCVVDVRVVRKKEQECTGNTHNVRLRGGAWGKHGAEGHKAVKTKRAV
jgi:hypothetical protein